MNTYAKLYTKLLSIHPHSYKANIYIDKLYNEISEYDFPSIHKEYVSDELYKIKLLILTKRANDAMCVLLNLCTFLQKQYAYQLIILNRIAKGHTVDVLGNLDVLPQCVRCHILNLAFP